MREKSSQSMNTTLRKMFIRGGETKVMKKTLSSLLVFALVLTMLVPAFAFAADAKPSAEEMAKKLSHIFQGDHTGDLNLDGKMDRAALSKVISILMNLEVKAPAADAVPAFNDVATGGASWAYKDGYIDAVVKAGYMDGVGNGQFNPAGDVSYAQIATVLARLLGIDNTGTGADWYAKNLAAVQGLGFLTNITAANANDAAPRSVLVEAAWLANEALNPAKPVVVGATKVDSVTADNYREVVVAFNGTVDKDSAEEVANYKIKGIDIASADLQEDGKTVVLTLNDTLFQQKAHVISVEDVKSSTEGEVVADYASSFIPLDVTVPTVSDIKALGTKAFQVTFSEPIETGANVLTNYKVDGKSVFGSIRTVSSKVVIVSATLEVGDHKLSVTNVKDYAGFAVNAIDLPFVVAEDSDAPEIVSIKSVDLTGVEIEFNEPVKSVGKVYHTAAINSVQPSQPNGSTKLTVNFINKMNLAETSVTVLAVEDFSGNKADRTVTLTPELDKTRPTVAVEVDETAKTVSLEYSKAVDASALNVANYVVKLDGKVDTSIGVNSKGNPFVVVPVNAKEYSFSLSGLKAGKYTLEISGVQDTSVIKNTMLPFTYSFEVGDTTATAINSVWYEEGTAKSGKADYNLFVQFNRDMAVEGSGSVLDRNKFRLYSDAASDWEALPSNASLEMVDSKTLLISFNTLAGKDYNEVSVTYVSDVTGKYWFAAGTNYVGTFAFTNNTSHTLGLKDAKATGKKTVVATVYGSLASINESDFTIAGTTLTYVSHEYSKGNTVITFASSLDLGANPTGFNLVVASNPQSQDGFGRKLQVASSVAVVDAVKPSLLSGALGWSVTDVNAASNEYKVTLNFDENVAINPTFAGVAASFVTVVTDGKAATVTGVSVNNNSFEILFTAENAVATTSFVEVKFDDTANQAYKVFTDASAGKNVINEVNVSALKYERP